MNTSATDANIAEATHMVRDSYGNVYLAGKRRVLKYDAAKQTVNVFAGTGFVGYTGDGGPASQATFRGGLSIALDPLERFLYIGDSASRVVRRVDLGTRVIHTIGFDGAFAPLRSIGAIAVRSNDRVYITDPAQCVIFELNDGLERFAGSGVCQGSLDGPGGDPADDYADNVLRRGASLHGSLGSIALDDSAGVLYFVEQSRVRQVIGNSVVTVAGTGVARWSVDGEGGDRSDDLGEYLDAASATIAPGAMVWLDGVSRALYIVDAAPSGLLRGAPDVRVRRFFVDDPILTTIAGPFPLTAVSALSVSDTGDVFMLAAQSAGRQVFHTTLYSQTVIVVAGNGNSGCGDDHPATEACVPAPQSVIADAGGNVTILEDSTAPIRKVDAATGIISTISAPNSFVGGQAGDVVTGTDGVYFSDAATHQVLRQDPLGAVIAVYGVALSQSGDPLGDGGPAGLATFQRPVGLAVDAQGNLFVADSFNRRVRRIDRQTQIITTIAADGTSCAPPFAGTHVEPPNPRNGFPATAACLDIPTRLAFDVGGDLLVTESGGHRIRRIAAGADGLITGAADEIISTIAGTGVPGYSGDGTESTNAAVDRPTGIVVAPDGTIFFSDTGNRVVRRIETGTRIITTIAGSASGGAADHITFGSDPSWTVLDAGGNNVGFAQNVCLGPFWAGPCPPGATGYGYGGGGWTASLNAIPGASWIWAPGITGATPGADSGAYFFRKDFFLAGTPTSASIAIAADNSATVLVNGINAGRVITQTALGTFDIAPFLVAGRNIIAVAAQNLPINCPTCTYQQNPAGVVFGGTIVTGGGSGALDPLQTALESPRGLAIGRQLDQSYLYIADSDLDMVLRLPIPVTVPSAPVTISVADAQVAEGNTGSTPLAFEVTLDAPSTHTVSVAYTTADGTATAGGGDYTPTNGVLTFLAGETLKQVVVSVLGDTNHESNEQFFLNLASPTGATLTRAQAVGTITDDDSPVMIVVNETIRVTDALDLRPSQMLTIADTLAVTDALGVQPSAMLTIADSISVTDAAGVLPSIMLDMSDDIAVTDTPGVVPQGGTPTPPGTGVLIPGRNAIGQLQPVTVRFTTVTQVGVTFADRIPAPPPLPANFTPHVPAVEVSTTAAFSGVITVCFTGSYPQQTRMLHYTGGLWVDVTVLQTTAQVCGQTTSLSPFVIGSFVGPPAIDRKRPVVTAPESITIVATESRGARAPDSPSLAAFLAGGSAVDNVDPSPVRLAPQVHGSPVTNDTLFPIGKTIVMFRFRDASGNVGEAPATVTVAKPADRCHGKGDHGHHDGDGCLPDHHGHYPGDNCRGRSADSFHHDVEGDEARDVRHLRFFEKR